MLRPNLREPTFDTVAAPQLARAWSDSQVQLAKVRDALHEVLPPFIACVAVSGSLARMEVHADSDIDLLIVVDDRTVSVSDQQLESVFFDAWDRLDALGATRPKHGGIFSVCARWKDLIDPAARGRIDESITVFGHRIQLLMDAQPVTSDETFVVLQRELLEWYSETRVAQLFDESGPLHWLWQDVQRYWRSLRARTSWLYADDPVNSLTLNTRLRSSRLLLVFAFLQTIAIAHETHAVGPGVIQSVVDHLYQTPAERLFGDNCQIEHWNSVWEFIRKQPEVAATSLPAAVNLDLQAISTWIQTEIVCHGDSPTGAEWTM